MVEYYDTRRRRSYSGSDAELRVRTASIEFVKEDFELTRKTAAAEPSASSPKGKAQAKSTLLSRILNSLDDDKAENVVTIDLEGRSALADAIVIASGRSQRHVAAIAEHLARRLKEAGYGTRPVSGAQAGDWALVDAGEVIVHVFRPEVRNYYDLEGMWSVEEPERARAR